MKHSHPWQREKLLKRFSTSFKIRAQENEEDVIMSEKLSAIVATFNTHTAAEEAVKEIQKAGFDMKKLSIVGKDYHSDEHVVGYYNVSDRAQTWGKLGAFWGGLWGLLFGSAFFLIPGMGPIVVAGPLVTWIVGALEGAVVVGGLSAIGAALFGIGIPKDSIILYETSLKANKFLLIDRGSPDEVEQIRKIVLTTKAIETIVHADITA
jgi:uncharacterized membrane protein